MFRWSAPNWIAEYEQEHHNLVKYEIIKNKKEFLAKLKTEGKIVSFTPEQITQLTMFAMAEDIELGGASTERFI